MLKKTNGFEKPNHTQTPNSFFDEIMKEIDTMAELKFTLAIIRQTIGWHRKRVRFGIGKIEHLTGMARNSVLAGAEAAEERGTVRRIQTDGEAEWELIIDEPPSNFEGANFAGGSDVDGGALQSLTKTPSKFEGLKRKKEIKTKEEGGDGEIFKALESLTGSLNSNTPKFVDIWKESHSVERIMQAIGVTKKNHARSINYIDQTLADWNKNGYPDERKNGISKNPAADAVTRYGIQQGFIAE